MRDPRPSRGVIGRRTGSMGETRLPPWDGAAKAAEDAAMERSQELAAGEQ